MYTNRRQVLRALGVAVAGGLAGCNGGGSDGDASPADDGPTPTVTPTATLTPKPTGGTTPDGDRTPVSTDTPQPSTDAETPTETAATTATPTATDTPSPTETPTPTASPTPTETPTPTASPTPTATPTATPTPSLQAAKLAASDGDADDYFGGAAALSADGTTAVIGAEADEDPNGPDGGSAYVFARTGGEWTQRAKLAAADGDAEDDFGVSVAVSRDGGTAVVGADSDDDPNGDNSGSAYVFTRSGGEWAQQAKLAADDGDDLDVFGSSVSVSADGTTVLVGANLDEDPHGRFAGSAYVFARSGGEWAQQAKLVADDGDPEDNFGVSVALSEDGSSAIVGAPLDEDPNGSQAGSAYEFVRSGDEWTQQAKFAAADGDPDDGFGYSVAVSRDGSTAVVGAEHDEDPNGDGAGSAYVFSRSSAGWTQRAKLAADDGESNDSFGYTVAVSGDGSTAVAGAYFDGTTNGDYSGSAYVFTDSGGDWDQQLKLTPADGDRNDRFGHAVATESDGSRILVGARLDNEPNGEHAGSAYVFNR